MAALTPKEIVNAYIDAIAARDFQRARGLLANGRFSTRSPISAFESADAYVTDISRVGPILEGIERRRVFADGDEVCVILDYITRMDRRQVTPVVHWMRIEDGKIVFIESFFDARGYDAFFQVD
jgi:predicted SnoaL-like aldol condensation-catalyzing enzyme